jgi:hypothetical protein
LTNGQNMFSGCKKLELRLTSLPKSLTNGNRMFYASKPAEITLNELPEGLVDGTDMFDITDRVQVNLRKLPKGLKYCHSMFRGVKCNLSFTELPDSITNGSSMFCETIISSFTITKLPAGLINGKSMFYYTGATINLDTLAANAPAEGWTALTNIAEMFCYSPNVTGSRSAFLAKCPADVTGASGAFTGTNTTE